MRFFIIDDDDAVRSMLAQIIEDEDLGEIAGEAEDGSMLNQNTLALKNVDILFIDLLMPIQDGIETVRQIKPFYKGKIIMISQVESKAMIGEAYSLGIEYYITKPINKFEVLGIIRRVIERIRLERSIQDIQKSLSAVFDSKGGQTRREEPLNEPQLRAAGRTLLAELGIAGENGSKDMFDILDYLHCEQTAKSEQGLPALKGIFESIAQRRLGESASAIELNREIKASEQRVRRAISQSLNHLASLGLTDYMNPKFEKYAPAFFDFTTVRKKMNELKDGSTAPASYRINTKKFIQVLYYEASKLLFDR
ncbi:response regulator [Scopulibacillus darangshiensis]|nr:response regulator [Scopulibacillus darangshiensis]